MRTLASITVKGFKSIACIENLTLGSMNILIGSNGAGKSNFLDIFSFLRMPSARETSVSTSYDRVGLTGFYTLALIAHHS